MIADLASFECDFLYNASYTLRFNLIKKLFGTMKGWISFAQIKNNNLCVSSTRTKNNKANNLNYKISKPYRKYLISR